MGFYSYFSERFDSEELFRRWPFFISTPNARVCSGLPTARCTPLLSVSCASPTIETTNGRCALSTTPSASERIGTCHAATATTGIPEKGTRRKTPCLFSLRCAALHVGAPLDCDRQSSRRVTWARRTPTLQGKGFASHFHSSLLWATNKQATINLPSLHVV